MNKSTSIKTFNTSKLIQLIITSILDITFFLLLILNKNLRNNIFENKTLTFLCIFIWVSVICFLIFLIIDLYFLKTLTLESHHLSQTAFLDDLTGIPNRHSLDLLFKNYTSSESVAQLGCCMVTISNLDQINQFHGREAGDSVLRNFSSLFEEVGDLYGFSGRNSGNEFVLVIEQCTHEKYQKFYDVLQNRIKSYNETPSSLSIEISIACVLNSEAHVPSLNQLFAATSAKLYK